MKITAVSHIITALLIAGLLFFPTGLTAADSGKTLTQVEKDVDALLTKMGSGSAAQAAAVKDVQKIGKAAVPRLLFHAMQEYTVQKQGISFGAPNESFSRNTKVQNPKRLMSLYLLQTVWSPDAVSQLTNLLKTDSNQEARLLAFAALDKNAKESLKTMMPSLVSDQNPEIAGIALERLELQAPDLARLSSAIARPEMWKSLELYLPRYYSGELAPKTLFMLKNGKTTNEKATAIVSLISQNSNSPEIRQYLAGLMESYDPAIRELSAEYLSWHGTDADLPRLDESMKNERDIYAMASMKAALASIKRRSSVKSGTAGEPVSAPASFKEAVKLLQSARTSTNIQSAFEFLKKSEAFEPLFIKGKKEDEPFNELRTERMKLTGLVFGIPAFCGDGSATAAGEKAAEADSLVPPIRNYLDQTRKSFGVRIGKISADSGELVRVCDIAGLRKTYLTVVAVGNGLVKSAEYNGNWGFTVIIEHTWADGRKFCSLYAHLSPFMHVKKDDIVSAGEKIGSVGRHFTWENGGFGAHLQFGIYNDAYDSSSAWQVSYTPAEEFAKGLHKWANPQSFIQEKIKSR
ncbi:MAG: peptidoglycan DD-metalloendopeptidase family protein [Victivallales bacterium]|jgi:murein DD-endopeptidase MepM/ murein hydrolase activator NlpD